MIKAVTYAFHGLASALEARNIRRISQLHGETPKSLSGFQDMYNIHTDAQAPHTHTLNTIRQHFLSLQRDHLPKNSEKGYECR